MTTLTHCPACNNEVPAAMPSCGWCGASLTPAAERQTVNVQAADRRVFGVPPATALLLIGGLAVGLGVYLLVTGGMLLGSIALVVGLLLLTGFPATARRADESRVARRAVRSYDGIRERANATLESLAARAAARRRLTLLAQDVEQLEHSRTEGLQRLGEATYAGDEREVERLRVEIAAADAALESKRVAREEVLLETEKQVEEARLRAQPTERFRRGEGDTLAAADDSAAADSDLGQTKDSGREAAL